MFRTVFQIIFHDPLKNTFSRVLAMRCVGILLRSALAGCNKMLSELIAVYSRKGIFQGVILILIVFLLAPSARAALNPANELDFCKIKIQEAFTDTMCCFGDKKKEESGGNRLGYANQLSALLSTNEQTFINLEEVEGLARDAKIELQGICEEAGKLDQMSEIYATVYDLNACKYMSKFTSSYTENRLKIFNFCEQEKDKRLADFLDQLEPYLMRQAIRTSFEPIVQALRTMNSKLLSLLTEYQRAVNNFYKFSFRLGETIVGGKPD